MSHKILPRPRLALPLCAGALLLAVSGCGGSQTSAQVPSLGNHASTSGEGSSRAAQLHAVAQCIRDHGIPNFPDPLLTAGGQVYYDLRTLQNASRDVADSARRACGGLAARAGFNPDSEPPAPPQLVAAGVRAAHCIRAHGLTNYRDPTASTPYVPGHGFQLTRDELPAGGKADPTFQRVVHACAHELNGEIQASTLGSLSHD